MKKFLIVLFIFAISFTSAQIQNSEINKYRERVAVSRDGRSDITQLKKMAIEVDYCSEFTRSRAYVFATPEEQALLKHLGYTVTPAPVIIGKNSRSYSYHTHETVTSELRDLANKYPKLARLYSIGKSGKGRDLWILKISDNVEKDEQEPEIKYISTMHGDEIVGQELLIFLAKLLLENYGKDPQMTKLVNGLEIWLMPNMNPDGTASKRRYNADWVDLNRNFPDPQKDKENSPSGRAIETQHMMKFTAEHNFCLSLNFHGGAVCVNYPWDTMYGQVPDIKLTLFLSLGYSKRNAPMYSSSSFKDGVTNGYDWYEVNGGMQDWNYHWHNGLELTIELSGRKWPNASTIPQYWKENKDSLVWFLEQGFRGVHGVVTDAKTGKPLKAVVDVLEIGKPVVSCPKNGDYHRILMPGNYTIKFSADGYESVTKSITVKDSTNIDSYLNIELQKK